MNLNITAKQLGSTNSTLTCKVPTYKGNIAELPINVVETSKTIYLRYTFYSPYAMHSGRVASSDVLVSGKDNTDLVLFSHSNLTYTDGICTAAEAPKWSLSETKIATNIVTKFEANSSGFDWDCWLLNNAVTPSGDYTGDTAYRLYNWNHEKKGFNNYDHMGSGAIITFKDLQYEKALVAFDEKPDDVITINTVTVDSEQHPDFANFAGCWTFDASKNCIEGTVYVEYKSATSFDRRTDYEQLKD